MITGQSSSRASTLTPQRNNSPGGDKRVHLMCDNCINTDCMNEILAEDYSRRLLGMCCMGPRSSYCRQGVLQTPYVPLHLGTDIGLLNMVPNCLCPYVGLGPCFIPSMFPRCIRTECSRPLLIQPLWELVECFVASQFSGTIRSTCCEQCHDVYAALSIAQKCKVPHAKPTSSSRRPSRSQMVGPFTVPLIPVLHGRFEGLGTHCL